jgi:hypothetical protein
LSLSSSELSITAFLFFCLLVAKEDSFIDDDDDVEESDETSEEEDGKVSLTHFSSRGTLVVPLI